MEGGEQLGCLLETRRGGKQGGFFGGEEVFIELQKNFLFTGLSWAVPTHHWPLPYC